MRYFMRIESITACHFIPDAKTETAQNRKVKVRKEGIRTPLFSLTMALFRITIKDNTMGSAKCRVILNAHGIQSLSFPAFCIRF